MKAITLRLYMIRLHSGDGLINRIYKGILGRQKKVRGVAEGSYPDSVICHHDDSFEKNMVFQLKTTFVTEQTVLKEFQQKCQNSL